MENSIFIYVWFNEADNICTINSILYIKNVAFSYLRLRNKYQKN